MRVILVLVSVFLMSACSNKAVYDDLQINKRRHCLTLPSDEYDDCMAETNKPYNEYERERREALEE